MRNLIEKLIGMVFSVEKAEMVVVTRKVDSRYKHSLESHSGTFPQYFINSIGETYHMPFFERSPDKEKLIEVRTTRIIKYISLMGIHLRDELNQDTIPIYQNENR